MLNKDKVRIALHKFSSCDGCQLAFLNLGEALLDLATQYDITHFAEAGMLNELATVDVAFVEGSISTHQDIERINAIRSKCTWLVTIGACATAGGLQALRNMANNDQWMEAVYTDPQFIDSLENVTAIKQHVHVDFELWGCPISKKQLLTLLNSYNLGVFPAENAEKLCLECKRQLNPCTLITQGAACMGPVTRSGCGALCPAFGRDCYSCYGPAENPNTHALANRLKGLGLLPEQIQNRFLTIYSATDAYSNEAQQWTEKPE